MHLTIKHGNEFEQNNNNKIKYTVKFMLNGSVFRGIIQTIPSSIGKKEMGPSF